MPARMAPISWTSPARLTRQRSLAAGTNENPGARLPASSRAEEGSGVSNVSAHAAFVRHRTRPMLKCGTGFFVPEGHELWPVPSCGASAMMARRWNSRTDASVVATAHFHGFLRDRRAADLGSRHLQDFHRLRACGGQAWGTSHHDPMLGPIIVTLQ
jgi:hypothetical protein